MQCIVLFKQSVTNARCLVAYVSLYLTIDKSMLVHSSQSSILGHPDDDLPHVLLTCQICVSVPNMVEIEHLVDNGPYLVRSNQAVHFLESAFEGNADEHEGER